LLEGGDLTSQGHIAELLGQLGAIRIRRYGHVVYGLPAPTEPRDPASDLRDAFDCVLSVEASVNLCVLRTAPGDAMHVAVAIDRADLPELIGTVGGDDTVLLIAREPWTGRQIEELCRTFMRDQARS
jgi:transcriptional regulator of arginine metabolism